MPDRPTAPARNSDHVDVARTFEAVADGPSLEHDDPLDRARIAAQRLVDDRLESDLRALPERDVCGQDDAGAAGANAIAERGVPEAGEYDRVDRPDPDGRQHRHDGLGTGRHVDRDPVAASDAETAQRGGRPADLGEQLARR